VEWKTVTGNRQVTRKLKEFAKMCYACNTSPKLALRTSVTTGHVTCELMCCGKLLSRYRSRGDWCCG